MKKRNLTGEEHALWSKVAKTARPLEGKSVEFSTRSTNLKNQKPVNSFKAATVTQPNRSEPQLKPNSGIDRRTGQRLRRGRVDIEARLDLHGQTQARAHSSLMYFLTRCQRDGIRFALIIPGKSGILNRMTPLWLSEPSLSHVVSGYQPAGPRHGGHGALYVRIRRAR